MLLGLSPPLTRGPELPVPISLGHMQSSGTRDWLRKAIVWVTVLLSRAWLPMDTPAPNSRLPYLSGKLLGDLSWEELGPLLTP